MKQALSLLLLIVFTVSSHAFDGKPWHIQTGNLSVHYIRCCPIGAGPLPGMFEQPPSVESLAKMKQDGLVVYEDYAAWGAEEREPGKWNWKQHDMVYDAVKKAGLEYVVLSWVHFPPAWLRDSGSDKRTLMRCVEHSKDTYYLSIFDPKTIEHYDHYYRALHEHFGNRLDGVWACILGPYSEGNYPLNVPDWINMGHCHEGYWCQDPYALAAFQNAMRQEYSDIAALNAAWGATYKSFRNILPPGEIKEGVKPSPEAFSTKQDRRRWLDFITWYHQAIIDFAEKSIQTTLKYWPKEKVRSGPGGNYGGMNPIAWGTYSPGYAKMAAPYGIYLQPADCFGAFYGDKWVATAYNFYGVKLSTEPARPLDKATFVRRLFSDASRGARQIFTYEFNDHVPEIQRYIHLLTGRTGDTDVAIYAPTTFYRLGGNFWPTVKASDKLRDVTDFDVMDELLIRDGALKSNYRFLVMFQGDYVEQSILDKIGEWVKAGGTLVVTGSAPVKNVDGDNWPILDAGTSQMGKGCVIQISSAPEDKATLEAVRQELMKSGCEVDEWDGVYCTRRGKEILLLNDTDKPVKKTVKVVGKSREVEIEPHAIMECR